MRTPPSWKECKRRFVKKVEPDPERAIFLIQTAEGRIKRTLRDSTENECSYIIEALYESIKELLTALMLRHGLRSQNHQCLFAWFANEYPHLEYEVMLLQQLCFKRNRLQYYGERIEQAFYEKNKQDILELIALLKKLLGY